MLYGEYPEQAQVDQQRLEKRDLRGRVDGLGHEQVADKADKIGCVGIKETERKGILLAVRSIGVVSHCFQGKHGHDIIFAFAGQGGINFTSHVTSNKKRWFFICECNHANCPGRFYVSQ